MWQHFQFSPNYFNLVFPNFSPNLPEFFFSIKNIQLSYFHPGVYRTKKQELIKYVVPIVSYDRECIQKL
jgi:hypothetical protein